MTKQERIAAGYESATPGNAQAAQAEIDRLNESVPIFSAKYKTPAHQARLQQLYRAVHGDRPVVGTIGRPL
jgi:hypothetical protein